MIFHPKIYFPPGFNFWDLADTFFHPTTFSAQSSHIADAFPDISTYSHPGAKTDCMEHTEKGQLSLPIFRLF